MKKDKKEKVAILTQPLRTNYGGLLQCYALCKVVRSLGLEPIVLDIKSNKDKNTWYYNLYNKIKKLDRVIRGKINIKSLFSSEFRAREEKDFLLISKYTRKFIDKYIASLSPGLYGKKEIVQYCLMENIRCFIVGSDQCWRPKYSPCIYNYYFDFSKYLPKDNIYISYAASFGVDEWEYGFWQGIRCKKLARVIKSSSVREKSGVFLCQKKLGLLAQHVLDPTMLLDREDYIKLVNDSKENKSSGSLFYYILDMNEIKRDIIAFASKRYALKAFTTYPLVRKEGELISEEHIVPPVECWIRSFYDAEVILTDSFHGCVFSIIFNKEFWVVANKGRGLARFNSLLSLFDLQDRLINSSKDINLEKKISWDKVNEVLQSEREKSKRFLFDNLAIKSDS